MKSFASDQRGVGHLGLILVVVVVLALGGVGYFVYSKNKGGSGGLDSAVRDAIANAKCEYDDADLCKFFAGYKAQNYFTISSTTQGGGESSTMVVKTEGKDKSHIKLEGKLAYEVISIGDTTYTKAADGTWWKQTTKNETASDLQSDAKVDIDEPTTTEAAQTTYKKLGKEPCGNLTCFKYQVVDPADTKTTSYVWFDDKDYQLRRTLTQDQTNKTDSTYSYDKVSIGEPSPVKDLAPNQYILPGQSEPSTLPSTSDGPSQEELRQLMEQYQNQYQ